MRQNTAFRSADSADPDLFVDVIEQEDLMDESSSSSFSPLEPPAKKRKISGSQSSLGALTELAEQRLLIHRETITFEEKKLELEISKHQQEVYLETLKMEHSFELKKMEIESIERLELAKAKLKIESEERLSQHRLELEMKQNSEQ